MMDAARTDTQRVTPVSRSIREKTMAHGYKWALSLVLDLVLTACGGSADTNQTARCNANSSMTVLTGTVTAVHDGDTLTLSTASTTEHVRLQGIDAPELAQPFGDAARQSLSQQSLNQTVRVAYAQRDRYDRLLGQIFTADCTDVNQQMLDAGMAWFYTAYACELESARRSRYEAAEAQAHAQRRGLWSQSQPMAPWIFRNGVDAPTPNCPG